MMATSGPPLSGQSASPPPEEPPNTSSVRHRRAEALEKLLDRTLDHTLNKVSYNNFSACFPTWADYRPSSLKDFHGKFVDRLRTTCKTNFEDILQQRSVVSNLNSLDNLINEAIARKEAAEVTAGATGNPVEVPIPPHQLTPDSLMAANLAPFLHQQQGRLKTQLSTLESQNVALAETVAQQTREVDMLISGLEQVIQDLERAAAMVQSEATRDLIQDTRSIEDELRASQQPS